MRFSYAESMIDPSFYLPLARAVEEAGYHGMVVPDSLCYPEVSDSTYPFNPDGSREFLDDKPFIEPFSLIPAMGVVTERIRFTTFVLKLPMRHPLLVAKQATSVAVLTGNRLSLGVGTSPWPEDYELVDVPWAGRGKRMDEAVDIVRGLSGGRVLRVPRRGLRPAVGQDHPGPDRAHPHPGGGPCRRALRRAARCDGWLHGGGDPADLPGLLRRLGEIRREEGTEDKPFEVHVISLDAFSVDGVRRLEDQGVTDVIVGFRWPYVVGPDTEPLQGKLDNLRRFADDVIGKVQGMTTARDLGQASMAAVEAHDREAWLALFEEDSSVEDPIGPSMFDPEGKGHRGLEAIAAFYDNVIAANESIRFTIVDSFLCGDEVANVGVIRITFPGGSAVEVDGVYTYRRSPDREDRRTAGLLGGRRHPDGGVGE